MRGFLETLHTKACDGRPALAFADGWRSASFRDKTPAQPNDFDCGVYMIASAWACVRRVSLAVALDAARVASRPESYWRARGHSSGKPPR